MSKAKNRPRLGRGLSSLISSHDEASDLRPEATSAQGTPPEGTSQEGTSHERVSHEEKSVERTALDGTSLKRTSLERTSSLGLTSDSEVSAERGGGGPPSPGAPETEPPARLADARDENPSERAGPTLGRDFPGASGMERTEGADAPPAGRAGSPIDIAIDSIRPNPHQPRRQINENALMELASTLRTTGLIQPIVVRAGGEDGEYELIAGERRWLAAKLAGLTHLPAIIRDVDERAQAEMALIENIQREDLNPIDRAVAYRTLQEHLGITQAVLAERLGEERSSIANFLRLLELAEPVRILVRDRKLSMGHAKLLAGVEDSLQQEGLAELVVGQELSVRNLERMLAGDLPPVAPPARASASASASPSAHLQDLEKSLTRQLGLRVQVRAGAKKGRGKMILHYGSLDQFDQLLERLGITSE